MKKIFILLAAGVAGSVIAGPGSVEPSAETEASRRAPETAVVVTPERNNRIVGKKYVFRGAFVQMVKADNPLQLLNPIAPAKYGSGEQNVTRHPATGRINGVKLFSIEF